MSHQENDNVQSSLEFIGLSASEISVYRTLLSMGPRPASVIAKRIGMQRTRVYDVMLSLESRGLVQVTHREKVRHFAPASRDKLIELIDIQKDVLSEKAQRCKSIVPLLFAEREEDKDGVEVQRVKGVRQVKELFANILEQEGTELIAIGDLERDLHLQPVLSRWALDFRKRRLHAGITLKVALQGPPDLLEERGLLRETLSSPDIPSGQLLIVGKDHLYIVELTTSPEVTVIENSAVCAVLAGLYRSWCSAVRRIC